MSSPPTTIPLNPNPPLTTILPATEKIHYKINLHLELTPSLTTIGEPHHILLWNHVGAVVLREYNTEDKDAGNNLAGICFLKTSGSIGGGGLGLGGCGCPITLTGNM